jgi:hypothetical protein
LLFSNYDVTNNDYGSQITGNVIVPTSDSSCIRPVYPGTEMTPAQLRKYFTQGISKFIIAGLPPAKNTYATRSLIISSVEGAVNAQTDATIMSWVTSMEKGNGCDVVNKYVSTMNPWNLVNARN